MLKVNHPFVYLLFLVLPCFAMTVHASTKPNILLLLADDFGYNDSAIYRDVYQQQPVSSMPALESLAKEGVRFTRFYTESTCSASRVALLTGRYPARQGFMPVARGISPDVVTLADFLKMEGYQTHHVGKWHIGEVNPQAFPTRQGFDTSYGFLGQWFLRGPDANGELRLKPPTYLNPWLYHVKSSHDAYQPKLHEGHLEDLLTQHTVKLIGQAKKNHPWFIYHAFYAPHTPIEPSAVFAAQFPDTQEGRYLALLAQLDVNLQKIFSALKDSGQWDNTIIVFASDNGSPEKHGKSNAPFSGGKAEYEEGGIRTPLLVKWNMNRDAGSTRHDVVSMMDIFPSLAAVVENKKTNMDFDGEARLQDQQAGERHAPLHFLSFGSLSTLSASGDMRFLRSWEGGVYTSSHLIRYTENRMPVDDSPGLFETFTRRFEKDSKNLFDQFLIWRDSVRWVPVEVKQQGKSRLISGSDFQRAPVNPAFAVAFSFTPDSAASRKLLLQQSGLIDVSINQGIINARVNGLEVQSGPLEQGQCHVVVLSGEFYDRFSSMREEPRSSRLHLVINGKQVASAEKPVHRFAVDDLSQPLRSDVVSGPYFFASQLLPDDKPVPSHLESATAGLCD